MPLTTEGPWSWTRGLAGPAGARPGDAADLPSAQEAEGKGAQRRAVPAVGVEPAGAEVPDQEPGAEVGGDPRQDGRGEIHGQPGRRRRTVLEELRNLQQSRRPDDGGGHQEAELGRVPVAEPRHQAPGHGHPEREMPGIRAMAWATPTTSAAPAVISDMGLNSASCSARPTSPRSDRRRSHSAPSRITPLTISAPAATRGLANSPLSAFSSTKPTSPPGTVASTSMSASRSSAPSKRPRRKPRTKAETIVTHSRR